MTSSFYKEAPLSRLKCLDFNPFHTGRTSTPCLQKRTCGCCLPVVQEKKKEGKKNGGEAAGSCQPILLKALFMFQKLKRSCQGAIQEADGAATHRLLPPSLENILGAFVVKGSQFPGNGRRGWGEGDKRWLRFPSGERVPLFSEHIVDDKRGLMNRNKWLQTLFWVGPASL